LLKEFQGQELGRVVAGYLTPEPQMEVTMTDPRDFDRRMDMERQAEMERSSSMGPTSPWGWIAGAVFIVVILALIFAGGDSTRTAREDEPARNDGHGAENRAADGCRPPGTATVDHRPERAAELTRNSGDL
jgi:hypothetical protein